MNVQRKFVFGPWNGKIDLTGGDRIALYADEGADVAHVFEVEKIKWKPQSPWPVRSGQNSFGIKRRSLSTYANEPKNWQAIGTADQQCSKNSDCSAVIDSCTSGVCVSGKCSYTALNCDHPNYSKCYPSNFCLDPKVYGTCTISSAIFGHTGFWGSPDLDIFGWYKDANNNDQMYWVAACPSRALPVSKTGGAHPTATCRADNRGDGNYNQNCQFPFSYEGKSYSECITEGWGRLWCGTEVDASGVATSYGACQCSTANGVDDQENAVDSDSSADSSSESSSELSKYAKILIGVTCGVCVAFIMVVVVLYKRGKKVEVV